jgi:hypothetical protein
MSPFLLKHGGNRLLSLGLVGLCALIVLGYTFFEFHALLFGPSVAIATPVDGQGVEHAYTLSGTAQRVSSLFLNGRLIELDESGVFEERLVAPDGSFILTLTARDRFGRESINRLTLYHEQDTRTYEIEETSTTSPERTDGEESAGE